LKHTPAETRPQRPARWLAAAREIGSTCSCSTLLRWRVTLDARQAGVDHITDAGHGERGLGDVGRQNHALALVRREHPRLLDGGLPCKQGKHFKTGWVVFPQRLGRLADFALAGQEHQHVAWPGTMGLVHGVDDGVVEIRVVLFVAKGR
jgi:hypothetical protein